MTDLRHEDLRPGGLPPSVAHHQEAADLVRTETLIDRDEAFIDAAHAFTSLAEAATRWLDAHAISTGRTPGA